MNGDFANYNPYMAHFQLIIFDVLVFVKQQNNFMKRSEQHYLGFKNSYLNRNSLKGGS